MRVTNYSYKRPIQQKRGSGGTIVIALFALLVFVVIGFAVWKFYQSNSQPSAQELLNEHLNVGGLEATLAEDIRQYALGNDIRLQSELIVSAEYTVKKPDDTKILGVYVPVTEQYATTRDIRQPFTVVEGKLTDFTTEPTDQYQYIEVNMLTPEYTLLSVDGVYYLDTFVDGAVFEAISFSGEQAADFEGFSTNNSLLSADTVFSMHTTGVTALTREMMNDLNAGVEPTFFSDSIGEFLASADITHVSNEVSFKEGCTYSRTLFCSPPEFIETLKASGVDVVELTGNHNNDVGSIYNTQTIELYDQLGWAHVGGGLNDEDAAKPYIVEKDGTKFGMLAYNYPDAPYGAAISGPDSAGANAYSDEKMRSDIESLKSQVDFVQVNIQFWECYAYPNGYIEYPECDYPIGQQEPVFKSVIDAGADMVVGSSAHQPQTFEKYGDGWIYYGLGNLYFEQTQWPGTERGLILTNYFKGGELIQTRITPTVYGDDFQARIMTQEESDYLLTRLNDAR